MPTPSDQQKALREALALAAEIEKIANRPGMGELFTNTGGNPRHASIQADMGRVREAISDAIKTIKHFLTPEQYDQSTRTLD